MRRSLSLRGVSHRLALCDGTLQAVVEVRVEHPGVLPLRNLARVVRGQLQRGDESVGGLAGERRPSGVCELFAVRVRPNRQSQA